MKKFILPIIAILLTGCASSNPSTSSSTASSFNANGKYARGELVYTYDSSNRVLNLEKGIDIVINQLSDHKIVYKADQDNNRCFEFDETTVDVEKWALVDVYISDIDCDNVIDLGVNLRKSGSSDIKNRALFYSFAKKTVIYEVNENYNEATFDSYVLNVNEEKELIIEQYDKKKFVSIYPLKYGRFLNNQKQEMSLEWATYDFRIYNIEPYMTNSVVEKTKTHIDGRWGYTVSKDVSYTLSVYADAVGDINDLFNQYREGNFFEVSYSKDFVSQLEVTERGGDHIYTTYTISFGQTGTTEVFFTMAHYSVSVKFTIA